MIEGFYADRGGLTRLWSAVIVAAILFIVAISASFLWIKKTRPFMPSPEEEVVEFGNLTRKRTVIEVEAEGIILHFRNESFWGEDQFSKILERKEEFKKELIEQFNQSLLEYGERNEHAIKAEIKFDEAKRSTIFECDVVGAVSKSGNSYHATFRWLLGPLNLDFIDGNFQHTKNGLLWEGSISGVPTKVILIFPVAVPAWGQPNGHCHAHVWWQA